MNPTTSASANPAPLYEERYTDAELEAIAEQALIYMCACPAQVAQTVRGLRKLLRYQHQCAADPENDGTVHQAIAEATVRAHATMQDCLDTVIALEQWDRATLRMPEGLRRRQLSELQAGASGRKGPGPA